MPLYYLALLHPKPDKVARVEEIAQSTCEYVHEKEPGVLKYQWFRAGGTEKPMIVVWEIGSAQVKLQDGLAYRNFPKEDNMAAPIEVMPLEEFAGWSSRV
ncbi:hypothetical protein MMYC01_207225 [Madurella mycetomatis]|uniref:ABM domain-containing protein n=1 Tax=Madurella mycetomatis TaxID=100816 RepID=A0A175VY25_9PEZI|nr:hypothetical protein MMYC01_207225 [Madurella mycetomatis]